MGGKRNKINGTPLLPRDMQISEAKTIVIGTNNYVEVANGTGHLSCF
jgi:hypothetical protein